MRNQEDFCDRTTGAVLRGTESLLTHRWREPDSNLRSRSCERLFWALPIGDRGTKGGATYWFRPETPMLAWSGSSRPFPFAEGPRVRIRLPPAASPSLQWTTGLRAKSPALSRGAGH